MNSTLSFTLLFESPLYSNEIRQWYPPYILQYSDNPKPRYVELPHLGDNITVVLYMY